MKPDYTAASTTTLGYYSPCLRFLCLCTGLLNATQDVVENTGHHHTNVVGDIRAVQQVRHRANIEGGVHKWHRNGKANEEGNEAGPFDCPAECGTPSLLKACRATGMQEEVDEDNGQPGADPVGDQQQEVFIFGRKPA